MVVLTVAMVWTTVHSGLLLAAAEIAQEACDYSGLFSVHCTFEATKGVPGRIASVAFWTTLSPARSSPKTSVAPFAVAPVFTSTHSALPSWMRITNVRCRSVVIAADGTNIVAYDRCTGHSTLANEPGVIDASRTSSST